MMKTQKIFFYCVDLRVEENGSMYGRFNVGTFLRGQSLTFANSLRRTLLSEIPGIMIKNVMIEGASHEFATLGGVKETVLEILLNLKKIIFVPYLLNSKELENFQALGFIKSFGPKHITASDLKLPLNVKCINRNTHIATLTSSELFSLRFHLEVRQPNQKSTTKAFSIEKQKTRNFLLDTVPMPVQKVNYVIRTLDEKKGTEDLVLEVWTDGSMNPQDVIQFALKNLTFFFSRFAIFTKNEKTFLALKK